MRICTLLVAAILMVTGIVLLRAPTALSADLYWDGDGTGAQGGGAGQWNTTTVHFSATSGGTVDKIWNNANVDNAIFNATSGIVSLAGPITVNTITTAISGYTIGNGGGVSGAANTLTFSGAGTGINTLHTSGTTTLTAVVSGTLTKTGPGRLELNNTSNPATNKYVLKGGALTAGGSNRFGTTAPTSLVSDFFTFDGGGLGFNSDISGIDLGATRGITIAAGGAFLSVTTNSVTVTISSPIVGTAGGDLTITGSDPFVGSSHNSGGVWTLSNTGNSFNGNVVLSGSSGSALKLGASGVIPDSAVVNIIAGGNTLDLATNNVTETVKSLAGNLGAVALGATGKLILDNPAGESFLGSFTSTATTAQVVKNGTGKWSVGGASTGFSGEFVLNSGTMVVAGINPFGTLAGAQLTINGGILSADANHPLSINLTNNLNADFSVDSSGGTGIISFQGTNKIKNSNRTITINGATTNLTYSSPVGEDVAGRTLTKAGIGILELDGKNTYSGGTTIQAGAISIDADGTLGPGPLSLAGGRLVVSASRNASTDPLANSINLTADSAITTSSAAANITLNISTSSISATAGTLTFRNDGADQSADLFDAQLSGSGFNFSRPLVIDNGATGKTRLSSYNLVSTTQTFLGVISGTGSFGRSVTSGMGGDTVFTEANTYSGGTSINSGRLIVNAGASTGSGPVNINGPVAVGNNGGTLAGVGSSNGLITVNNLGVISPGSIAGSMIGTYTANGGLTLQAGTLAGDPGAVLNFDLGAPGTADLINVMNSGGLTINGGTVNLFNAGGLAFGDYTLIDYSGVLGGTGNLVLGTEPMSTTFSYRLVNDTVNTQILLHVGPPVIGDYNNSGTVDAADYVLWRKNVGQPKGTLSNDTSSDNPIGSSQYNLWRSNFGQTSGSGSGSLSGRSAVPEPGTLALMILALSAAVIVRCR